MSVRSILAVVAVTGLIQGCAVSPANQAKMDEYNRTVPTCNSDEECQVKWDAAQVWVVQNSGYRVQTATNVLIETFGPTGYSTALAFRVLREPTGSGSYRILIGAGCDNAFGCMPNQYDAIVAFNRAVNAANP